MAVPKHRRSHLDVVVHHVECLGPAMITRRGRLPVVKPAHVLLDLGARLTPDPLAIALNEALAKRLTTVPQIEAAIELRRGHPGRGPLTAALIAARDDPGAGRTQGELEALVLPKLRALPGLPAYQRNAVVELANGRLAKPDVWFSGPRVMVELDSPTWHEQRRAMDDDRRRDQEATAAGLLPFRITWRHASHEWDRTAENLLATLDRRGH